VANLWVGNLVILQLVDIAIRGPKDTYAPENDFNPS